MVLTVRLQPLIHPFLNESGFGGHSSIGGGIAGTYRFFLGGGRGCTKPCVHKTKQKILSAKLLKHLHSTFGSDQENLACNLSFSWYRWVQKGGNLEKKRAGKKKPDKTAGLPAMDGGCWRGCLPGLRLPILLSLLHLGLIPTREALLLGLRVFDLEQERRSTSFMFVGDCYQHTKMHSDTVSF